MIENRVKKTNWYCNSIPNVDNYPGDKWYRNHLERNYDVVNLGSSSAVFCFDYRNLGVKGFNWALKPQSMEYSFKVLKQYFSIIKDKGIVLIPFSPFSGLSVTGIWNERINDKYYYILDKTLIDNYSAVSKRRMYPFLASPKEALKRLIKDVPCIDMYSYNIQCHTADEFEKSAEKWIKLWMKQFNITDINAPLSNENLKGRYNRINTIRNIIDFCVERNLQPVIIIPPIHSSLNKYFSKEFAENYIYSFIRELDRPLIKTLDYLNDSFLNIDSYYRDAYFMNEKGANVFTKQVLTELMIIR